MTPILHAGVPCIIATTNGTLSVPAGTSIPVPVGGPWTVSLTNGVSVAVDPSGCAALVVVDNGTGPSVLPIADTRVADVSVGMMIGFSAGFTVMALKLFRSQPLTPVSL